MTKDRMNVLELLRKEAPDANLDFLREGLRVLIQAVMEAEVATKIGAGLGARSSERITYRNGCRARPWDTRVGTLELQVPKVREGSYFPSLLEPRRRSERALLAVVQQAYVEGVSTRRVENLVQALGCEGISKSQVSRICSELDFVVDSFLGRPLDGGPYPYLWLDALTQKVREAATVVWKAADRICGKRLKAALPDLVDSMERHEHLRLDPGGKGPSPGRQCSHVGPAAQTGEGQGRGQAQARRTTRAGRQIPVRTYRMPAIERWGGRCVGTCWACACTGIGSFGTHWRGAGDGDHRPGRDAATRRSCGAQER